MGESLEALDGIIGSRYYVFLFHPHGAGSRNSRLRLFSKKQRDHNRWPGDFWFLSCLFDRNHAVRQVVQPLLSVAKGSCFDDFALSALDTLSSRNRRLGVESQDFHGGLADRSAFCSFYDAWLQRVASGRTRELSVSGLPRPGGFAATSGRISNRNNGLLSREA